MFFWNCVHKSLQGVRSIVFTIVYGLWWTSEAWKSWLRMLGSECWWWWRSGAADFSHSEPQYFSLPSQLPQWPKGKGFGSGRISLGEIEVAEIIRFEKIWDYTVGHGKPKGIIFYRPTGIPDGFSCLGHYCQPNDQPLRGHVLVARDAVTECRVDKSHSASRPPALQKPVNYTLIWSADSKYNGSGYIWLPNPPMGYRAMGFVVTDKPGEPHLDEVRCIRGELVDSCEPCDLIFTKDSPKDPFQIWKTRPSKRGIFGRGVSVGTFFCRTTNSNSKEELNIACLKNNDTSLHAMPNLDQIHALIQHYGPTVFFHPDEVYLPSSIEWFFKNGALLYQKGKKGQPIDCQGSNLPCGGKNDGEFWIDLPSDDEANHLKKGNLESAELYAHVKPALGGTFTDIALWVFCPFNGPSTLKVGFVSIEMNKVGEHVGDWEHFTLRVSNFTGEIRSIYFSQHSRGKWVDACDLEFTEGNKTIVYASKNGHASFPHPGTYLQGSSKLGIGVRNDAARSDKFVDSSRRYQIIAAEYLGEGVVEEPCWLQFMREWGPTIEYDSRSDVDKIINLLPVFVRSRMESLFDLLPTEFYGEEGPTGPKEKNNWVGDERW